LAWSIALRLSTTSCAARTSTNKLVTKSMAIKYRPGSDYRCNMRAIQYVPCYQPTHTHRVATSPPKTHSNSYITLLRRPLHLLPLVHSLRYHRTHASPSLSMPRDEADAQEDEETHDEEYGDVSPGDAQNIGCEDATTLLRVKE